MSLFKLLRKGEVRIPSEIRAQIPPISPADTFTVNAQNIWTAMDEIVKDTPSTEMVWFNAQSLPCVTPPHAKMWFEWRAGDVRTGALIVRTAGPATGFRVDGSLWCEGPRGGAYCYLLFNADLAAEGKLTGAVRVSYDYTETALDENGRNVRALLLFVIFDAIAKMHCRNVRLVPIYEGKHRPASRGPIAPATVWHRIVITADPVEQTTGADVFREGADCREYTVRGHYADYRTGKGLFGRHKVVIWIPDHKRGNPELGQIIPEYQIA